MIGRLIDRLIGRLVLPRGWTRRWCGAVPILPAYLDLMFREHYAEHYRAAINERNPLLSLLDNA